MPISGFQQWPGTALLVSTLFCAVIIQFIAVQYLLLLSEFQRHKLRSSSGQNDQSAAIPKTFPRLTHPPTHPPDLIATFAQIQIYCAGLKIWIYCRNLKSKFKWSITWSGGSCIERFIPVIRPRPCLCTIIQPTAFHWTVAIFLHIVVHFTEHFLQFSEMLLIICTLVCISLNFC